MTIFYLIRHGETDWTLNEKYQLKGGYRDLTSLTKLGITQAEKISNDYRLGKAEFILSSPYTRAIQTAAIISKNTNLAITVELNLREWQPDLDLGTSNQFELRDAVDEYEKMNGIYPLDTPKRWESKSSLKNRVVEVLKKYLNYKCLIVVTHQEVIKTLIEIREVPLCSINQIEII